MPNSLLSTKLFIPPPRLNQVARERLILRLNDGVRDFRPLILVSAQAGFGKTTLVSAWLHQVETGWSTAWVSLDEGDNDPVLFVRYLAAGLQKAAPQLGEVLQPVFSSLQLPPLPELCALLINAVSQGGQKLLLVLDDYHVITSPEIHAFMQMLVEHMPEPMRLVLVTREDPPFPLPRLRARGQVAEIRERDLRFTQPEAERFFDDAMGLDLLPQWVEVLADHTEGWVAGLQLAALAILENPDRESIEGFLRTFTGSDRYVVDYLLDEVYNRQPPEVQSFFLASCILERMCAPLCDALLACCNPAGGEDTSSSAPSPASSAASRSVHRSADLLQRLERGNLFLVPLDGQRTWYRYHHLFAELLRHRLQLERSPAHIAELHRTASRWLEQQGDLTDAIRHAFQTGDWDFTISLIERCAMNFVSRSQINTLLDWYRRIPEAVLRERPLACVYIAWALVLTFREDYRPVVESWLVWAEQALATEDLPETVCIGPTAEPVNLRAYVTGQVAVIRSQNLLASYSDPVDPQELIALSQQADVLLPPVAKIERSVCAINLALAHLSLSQAAEASSALERAHRLTLESDNHYGAVTCLWYQARLAFYQGQPERALEIISDGLDYYRALLPAPDHDLPAVRSLYVVRAIVQFEQNDMDGAARSLAQSLDLTNWASWVELLGYAMHVRLCQARGDLEGTVQSLHRMEKMGPQQAACAEGLRVLHALMQAEAHSGSAPEADSAAAAWASEHAPDTDRFGIVTGLGPYHCDALYLKDTTWARVQIALGQGQAALAFLEPVLAVARRSGLIYREAQLSIYKAMAQDIAGNRQAALQTLGEALNLGERHTFLRLFDQGPQLDALLAEYAQKHGRLAFIQTLTDAFARPILTAVASPRAAAAARQGLVEPLSDRELEVLHLIASGCSNADICARLVIALGTVKRHINNIYGKLEVQSRTQAVEKARRLGLLG